ncbi:WD40-repeat-containing domain protein [Dichomitus squalens]|uniref:WD40-repeat-containing domain protein n=1 Tax=Dichomitus squalens TaxID=114155 RepID=A0A4Q9N489_9APHY|nr:WD40-repeat-containing domain protein [Dichomitus squalens]
MSPVLPWEVIEGVVDQACHDFDLLCSFSLACHQLRPRSLLLLINSVHLKSKEQALAFYEFLRTQTGSRLRGHVHSLTISPVDVPHFPPIQSLPNLSTLAFIPRGRQEYPSGRPTSCLHTSHLRCYHRYGENIRSLELGNLSLSTCTDLCRLILAFPNTTNIECRGISVEPPAKAVPDMVLMRNKLSQQLQPDTINIHEEVDEAVASLLLHCSRGTVQTLMWTGQLDVVPPAFLTPSEWQRLHTLTIGSELGEEPGGIERMTAFFAKFHPPSLEDVSVHFLVTHREILDQRFDSDKSKESKWIDICSKLEAVLSTFRRQRLSFMVSARERLWTRELGRRFPALRDRKRLAVTCKSTAVGHESVAYTVVVSPDSRWIASGSEDNTIIVWDSDGKLCDEWIAHQGDVNSLAFSPDSRLLASAGHDEKVVIWDLNQDARRVATLRGHTDVVWSCAWSPDGTTIASGGGDKSIRLWDTKTFEQLHLFDGAHQSNVSFVRFSPDGRWLASGSWDYYCCMWDVASGTLHRVLRGHTSALSAAAFDPGSTHLATASYDFTVRIWDVKAGEPIFVLWRHTNWVRDVGFSPDGSLLLSASDDRVKIWDASTGVTIMSLEEHSGYVMAACFSPCGRYVASASADKTVRLWRTSDGSCVATFTEHGEEVYDVAFSPDGHTLLSGGGDGNVFLRRLADVVRNGH